MISWIKRIHLAFKARKGRKVYNKIAEKLVSTKNIKDPFSNSTNYICLGDLFLESALDANALNNILEGYGISNLENAIDATSSPVIETLALMGKDSHFKDGFGKNITDPNYFPDIIPKSNLYNLQEYLESKNWSTPSLGGHVGERFVHRGISENGYHVEYPIGGNNWGFDLLVEKRFFEDNNLPFIPDSEFSQIDNPTGLGVLQVKTTPTHKEALEHFTDSEKYNIPVVMPDQAASAASLEQFQNKILEFSKLGINYEEIINTTQIESEHIISGHFGFVKQGAEIDVLAESAQGYYGFDLPNVSGLEIPYLGLAITAFLSTSRGYKQYISKQIDLPDLVINTSKDIATSGIAGMGSMAFTGFLSNQILGHQDGLTEVWSDSMSSLADGFDWEDLEEIAELALLIAAGMWAFKGIKKLLGFNTKDPLEEIKKEMKVLEEVYSNFSKGIQSNRSDTINFAESLLKDFHIKRLEKINVELEKFSALSKKIAKPMLFYFLKYAKKKQEKILSYIDKNKIKFPHGVLEDSINRLQVLEQLKPLRYKKISNAIWEVYYPINDKNIRNTFDKYINDLKNPNKKKIPKILDNIIHGELNFLINILENISIENNQKLKSNILPLIKDLKEQLKLVSSIYKKLVNEGHIKKKNIKTV